MARNRFRQGMIAFGLWVCGWGMHASGHDVWSLIIGAVVSFAFWLAVVGDSHAST